MTGIEVILVEDNLTLREELTFSLRHAGCTVREAVDGVALEALLTDRPCEVVVLDVHLPGESGLDIARRLAAGRRLGIVMLTARGEMDDKVNGLGAGADVYLVKPVDHRELIACIAAVHRRLDRNGVGGSIKVDDGAAPWLLQGSRRELASPDGRVLELSAQEFAALAVLVECQGVPCERDDLDRVLGFAAMTTSDGRTNTVIYRLRQKLAAFSPDLRIVAWRSRGYSYVGPRIVRQA